ncbi:phage exclusion protein Lit family protein [Bacteroides intestinalis]|uniref:phage exclusion protein Lit family protein n=1 Tax=Bacteroides intestinalis TaxID=329854 RepID=UPI00189CC802|nr:phage exclusion protein Lit family protein [Bacteroides intestinalis]
MAQEINTPIYNLANQIVARFENTNSDFYKLAKKLIAQGTIQRGIQWDRSNTSMKSPHIYKGSIYVQEIFLCHLWIICYYGLVIYEEAIAKHYANTYEGGSYIINKELISRCEDFLEYTISLYYGYVEWDIDKFPSPIHSDISGKDYHLKANQLFLYAINYILCHEFAHAELGHTGEGKPEKENEADKRAYELMLDGCNGDNNMGIKMGILMALCSLLMITPSPCKNGTHPVVYNRIKTYLEFLNPEETSQLWSVACLFLGVWSMRYNKDYLFPDEVSTHKEMFYKVIDEIEASN